MDPIEMLVDGAIQHQVISGDKNPYLTLETIVLRLIGKILNHTRISPSSLSGLVHSGNPKQQSVLFSEWHEEIRSSYETSHRHSMSQDERAIVERVLSKDQPHPSELSKFACCWYKYDRAGACRLFAVDGILGAHPKSYAGEAFSNLYAKHNAAVRELYAYFDDPEEIRNIIVRAYEIADPVFDDGGNQSTIEPQCLGLYAEMVGEEEIKRVVSERLSKARQLIEKPVKRKARNNNSKENKKSKRPKTREEEEFIPMFSPPNSPPSSPMHFFSSRHDA